MNRLVQGDVGSGKTMVAFLSMLIAIGSGYQCAFMAPTEILAEQHFKGLQEQAKQMGLHIARLTGSTPTSERKTHTRRADVRSDHYSGRYARAAGGQSKV